jgi:hypothetical protein
MIPTRVVDEAIDIITFPDPSESFNLYGRTIENTTVVAPSVQIPLGGGTLGSYTHKESKTVPVSLHIEKNIEVHGKHTEIRWLVDLLFEILCLFIPYIYKAIQERWEQVLPIDHKASSCGYQTISFVIRVRPSHTSYSAIAPESEKMAFFCERVQTPT